MKIGFPNNIFARQMCAALPAAYRDMVVFRPAASLSPAVDQKELDIALVPPLDLLTRHHLFVSPKLGISFEGTISNSYIYFEPGQKDLNKLALIGDVSSVEVLISKILFKELYEVEIEIVLSTGGEKSLNHLITGDLNWQNGKFKNGLSVSDEMIELLGFPFVNYAFVSPDRDKLLTLESDLAGIEQKVYDLCSNAAPALFPDDDANEFFNDSIHNVIYQFDEQDRNGIIEMLRLPYFHGLTDQIVDVQWA